MVAENFSRSIAAVLRHEGGYVDHPRDPGGATNRGITIATLRSYRGEGVTKTDVRNLTKAEAEEIYRKKYWDKVRADELPQGLDYAVFDFAVNSGASRAAKFLQKILGVVEDGSIGPKTISAIRRHDPVSISNTLCDTRLTWLKRLKTWGAFGRGWGRRVIGVKELANTMAQGAPPAVRPPSVGAPRGFWSGFFKELISYITGRRNR